MKQPRTGGCAQFLFDRQITVLFRSMVSALIAHAVGSVRRCVPIEEMKRARNPGRAEPRLCDDGRQSFHQAVGQNDDRATSNYIQEVMVSRGDDHDCH